MWEIPLYLIIAPLLMLIVTLIGSMKYKKYFLGPLITLIGLNIPTIVLPLYYNVGWSALLGWAMLYTVLSSVISFVVWMLRKNLKKTDEQFNG